MASRLPVHGDPHLADLAALLEELRQAVPDVVLRHVVVKALDEDGGAAHGAGEGLPLPRRVLPLGGVVKPKGPAQVVCPVELPDGLGGVLGGGEADVAEAPGPAVLAVSDVHGHHLAAQAPEEFRHGLLVSSPREVAREDSGALAWVLPVEPGALRGGGGRGRVAALLVDLQSLGLLLALALAVTVLLLALALLLGVLAVARVGGVAASARVRAGGVAASVIRAGRRGRRGVLLLLLLSLGLGLLLARGVVGVGVGVGGVATAGRVVVRVARRRRRVLLLLGLLFLGLLGLLLLALALALAVAARGRRGVVRVAVVRTAAAAGIVRAGGVLLHFTLLGALGAAVVVLELALDALQGASDENCETTKERKLREKSARCSERGASRGGLFRSYRQEVA